MMGTSFEGSPKCPYIYAVTVHLQYDSVEQASGQRREHVVASAGGPRTL